MRSIAMLLGSLALAGCVDPSLSNTNFDEWCGDLPCGWELNAGAVARVGTWHEHDYGAELVGEPAQLSQYTDHIPTDCLRIDVVASSEDDARLSLVLDFDDDGITDYEQPLPPSRFRAHMFHVRPPLGYAAVRHILRKAGPGRAVIGKLSSKSDFGCFGERVMLAAGSVCTADASCAAGRCHDGRCASCAIGTCQEGALCAEDLDCADGACAGGVCRSCAKTGSCSARESCTSSAQCSSGACVMGSLPSSARRPLHDGVCAECATDAQCQSGRCVLGFCAECAASTDCAPGLDCRYVDDYDATARACLPALPKRRARGALCESDVDCEPGISCGADAGRAKRCGISCGASTQCDDLGASCAQPGVRKIVDSSELIVTPRFVDEVAARIATCHERPGSLPGSLLACSVDAHCPSFAQSCCAGHCTALPIERETGMCSTEAAP